MKHIFHDKNRNFAPTGRGQVCPTEGPGMPDRGHFPPYGHHAGDVFEYIDVRSKGVVAL